MSPKKLLLSHPLVWERNRHWRAPYRGGTKTKEEHQGLYEQRRGKEFTFAQDLDTRRIDANMQAGLLTLL